MAECGNAPVDKRGRQIIFEPIAERLICKGYVAGEDVQEMADAFGVSGHTIREVLTKNNIYIRPVGQPSTYKSHQQNRTRDYQGDRECERRKKDVEKIKEENKRYEAKRRIREKFQGKRSHRGESHKGRK